MKNDQPLNNVNPLSLAIIKSWRGLKSAYQHEAAFRQEVLLFILLFPIALFIADSFVEFALLISGLFGVIVAELLNSGIEVTIDRIGLERHELSGRAKDLGSAAVLVAIFYCLLIWGYKIISLFI